MDPPERSKEVAFLSFPYRPQDPFSPDFDDLMQVRTWPSSTQAASGFIPTSCDGFWMLAVDDDTNALLDVSADISVAALDANGVGIDELLDQYRQYLRENLPGKNASIEFFGYREKFYHNDNGQDEEELKLVFRGVPADWGRQLVVGAAVINPGLRPGNDELCATPLCIVDRLHLHGPLAEQDPVPLFSMIHRPCGSRIVLDHVLIPEFRKMEADTAMAFVQSLFLSEGTSPSAARPRPVRL